MTDLELLTALTRAEAHLSKIEADAFWDMRACLESKVVKLLSPKQRQWAESVFEKLELDTTENLWSNGNVPVGRHVQPPDVLTNLPKNVRRVEILET